MYISSAILSESCIIIIILLYPMHICALRCADAGQVLAIIARLTIILISIYTIICNFNPVCKSSVQHIRYICYKTKRVEVGSQDNQDTLGNQGNQQQVEDRQDNQLVVVGTLGNHKEVELDIPLGGRQGFVVVVLLMVVHIAELDVTVVEEHVHLDPVHIHNIDIVHN